MKIEDLCRLVQVVTDSNLSDFTYEENGVKVSMRSKMGQEGGSVLPVPGETSSSLPSSEGQTVDSPLVGIFYAAPSETDAPFVQVGDWVKKGQTVAIVEAMKLMNEIECSCDGQVIEILAQNGQTVEYGQPLIRVQTR